MEAWDEKKRISQERLLAFRLQKEGAGWWTRGAGTFAEEKRPRAMLFFRYRLHSAVLFLRQRDSRAEHVVQEKAKQGETASLWEIALEALVQRPDRLGKTGRLGWFA